MKAAYFEDYGGSDKIQIGDLPAPVAGPGEILIAVRASGVNPIDWKIREGLTKGVFAAEFPVVPGWEAAGVVAAVGADVKGFAEGDAVYGYFRKIPLRYGTYAQYVVAPAGDVAGIPEGLAFTDAAAIPLCALTAWEALVDFATLGEGQTVLIHAGAGGVGSMAIQLAHHLGARVLTTCSAKNAQYCADLGADATIDYRAARFADVVSEAIPEGLDMVLDAVGGETTGQSIDLIRAGGKLACITTPADEAACADRGIDCRRIISGPNGPWMRRISALIEDDAIKPPEVRVLALEEAAFAMEISKGGHVRGKLVLEMPADA